MPVIEQQSHQQTYSRTGETKLFSVDLNQLVRALLNTDIPQLSYHTHTSISTLTKP